jgi:hypothetical protein
VINVEVSLIQSKYIPLITHTLTTPEQTNTTHPLAAPPTHNPSTSTYFAGISSLVQLDSKSLALSFLPYVAGEDEVNAAASWSKVSSVVAPPPVQNGTGESETGTGNSGKAPGGSGGNGSGANGGANDADANGGVGVVGAAGTSVMAVVGVVSVLVLVVL